MIVFNVLKDHKWDSCDLLSRHFLKDKTDVLYDANFRNTDEFFNGTFDEWDHPYVE